MPRNSVSCYRTRDKINRTIARSVDPHGCIEQKGHLELVRTI